MKQKLRKQFVLVPIGLFLISGTLAVSQFAQLPDLVSGLLFGTGIGLMVLPFLYQKIRPIGY